MCGVPKANILGPPLYIICINDIANCSGLGSILYADDAALMLTDENINRLKNDEQGIFNGK